MYDLAFFSEKMLDHNIFLRNQVYNFLDFVIYNRYILVAITKQINENYHDYIFSNNYASVNEKGFIIRMQTC
jgi:hypothetical protein